jgi:hypothetical protein
LTGGAQAKNIFWQVAGAVTFGTTSHFEGNILGQTGINLQTGASINGRMLAQTAVTLQMNTVTKPVDTTVIPVDTIETPVHTTAMATVSLAGASNLAVLAGSTITNTGPTRITGDLGLSPGSSVTGFLPGILNGTQHINDFIANQAKLDLTAAYNDAAGRTSTDIVMLSGNIGGLTLTPGLYKSTSSLAISSGDLTLDAKGDSSAVFIIQIASTLTTTSGRKVILSGGALASNIFWQVGSSATFGTYSVFKGTVLAMASITFTTGATLDGRGLARTGAVTMDSNTIVSP